ncbi:replication protein [Streptococcus danieliae]|nr:replication protein [Streptococcus danieliae]
MLALLNSKTIDEASKKAGIGRTTGHKYLKSVKFRKAYREARSDVMQQATALLQSASREAVEVLREIMNDHTISPYARQQSARTILEFGYKAHENEHILEVIEELEARFEDES